MCILGERPLDVISTDSVPHTDVHFLIVLFFLSLVRSSLIYCIGSTVEILTDLVDLVSSVPSLVLLS